MLLNSDSVFRLVVITADGLHVVLRQNPEFTYKHTPHSCNALSSPTSLDVRRTRVSTVGGRAFPVSAARLWNSIPSHVTAAPALSIFCCRLKSHIFPLSYAAFRLFSHLYSAHAVKCPCSDSSFWTL